MPATKKPIAFPPSGTRHTVIGGIDPIGLSLLLENHYDDTGGPEGSWYRRIYQDVLDELLEGFPQAAAIRHLLDAIDDGPAILEESMRRAGFVVGFQCCRQLLLGELDLEQLKGGAE